MPSGSPARSKRNYGGWILFLATLLVLSFAAMPGFEKFSRAADLTLIAVRLSLVVALSVLIVQERLVTPKETTVSGRASKTLLQRCRRWFYDE